MIIFGAGPRYKTVGKGHFFCPHCQAERTYERKQGKQYLTLYFLPVLPIGEAGEFIECTTCGTTYAPDILDTSAPKAKNDAPATLADLLNQLEAILRGGRPVEYVLRDLNAAGLAHDAARRTVQAHIGDARRVCPQDGLHYADNVTTCAECGATLNDA